MPKFRLVIRLGNEAMQTHEDVGRCLQRLAKALRSTLMNEDTLRDDNGNTVGEWRFDDATK